MQRIIEGNNYKIVISSKLMQDLEGMYNLHFRITDPLRYDPNFTAFWTPYPSAEFSIYKNNKLLRTLTKGLSTDYGSWAYSYKDELTSPGFYHIVAKYIRTIRKGFWPFYFGTENHRITNVAKTFPFKTKVLDQFILEL